MMLDIKNLVRPMLIAVVMFGSAGSHAEYVLPANEIGYKMILDTNSMSEQGITFIRFAQIDNLTTPFILIETKTHNMIIAEILVEQRDNTLHGKIVLPAGVAAEDIKELRINGYSVLWKIQ